MKIHGIEHSKRVIQNGLIISKLNGANEEVIKLFGLYHDCMRENDGHDPEHGRRASDLLKSIRQITPKKINLTDAEFDELCFACENHTTMNKSGNITIDSCFDADRLDLKRVGITPDPELMATETGAFFAQNIELFEANKQVIYCDQ